MKWKLCWGSGVPWKAPPAFFFYLAELGLSCSMWALNCCIWDLVPWPGIETGPPALGVQSLSHWTTGEVPWPDIESPVLFILCSILPSVQFSSVHSVMSGSLPPQGLQHARPPCPSPTPVVYSDSCPLSQWCHPTTSSSVAPFSSCLQFFPASRSFPVSQLFTSGGQSIGVSASASVLPMNIQDWFPLGWTCWISLQSKELSRVFPTP